MATHIKDILTPEDLQAISSLDILARLVVEGFCTGLHKSPHKGFSVEFRQHRQYVPGDDIRHIDWKVYAKSDRYFIREYEEETNLRATLIVDKSGSMNYGSGKITKYEYALRFAACLSHLMLRQADAVGLVTFDTKIRDFIPARSQANHLTVLLETLSNCKPGDETDISIVLNNLVPKLSKRGLLLIISDCFGDVKELLKSLAHFRHARHEIIVFQVWDRDELEFPFRQWTRFKGLEQLDLEHLVDPAQLRKAYLKQVNDFRDDLLQGCRRHRIDLVPLVTDQPYAEALAEYLTRRKQYG
jgi:uncharacterized protein (DUF58 family)